MNLAISTTNVCKEFPVDSNRLSMFRALKSKLHGKYLQTNNCLALNDINMEIMRGEKIGLIGNNGAGKTTLLKVVAGLYAPSKGQVYIKGNFSFLAGLGIGMVDDLSVEENIFLYSAIYGIDRNKTKEDFREIIEWAELQNFVGAKLKTLSTGMRTRLAFSASRFVGSDIYLFDEVLSAGDKNFKEKCEEVFENYKKGDKTFLFSSHNTEFVKRFCSKTLWLHKGKQMAFGNTEMVLQQYAEFNPK